MTEIDAPFQPGTVKPESDYLELQRLGKKLGIPVVQQFIKLESLAPDGSLHAAYEDRSRTLNRNYWNWFYKQFGGFITSTSGPATTLAMASDTTFGAGHLTNKNTAGTVANTSATTFGGGPAAMGSAGSVAAGLVAGTGVAAESFEDVALGALIAHGNGAGQLAYQAMTLGTPAYNAGTLTWTWACSRVLNNNSGGTIVVGETGLYAFNGNGNTYMIARDLLSPAVSVLNAGQLTITVTQTLTFPA